MCELHSVNGVDPPEREEEVLTIPVGEYNEGNMRPIRPQGPMGFRVIEKGMG